MNEFALCDDDDEGIGIVVALEQSATLFHLINRAVKHMVVEFFDRGIAGWFVIFCKIIYFLRGFV